jgi:CheY-like chemotaxis protein
LQVPDLQRKELRILMLEGDRNDVILQQRELKKGGLSFVSKWVVTREDFIRELTDFEPDIILSDYELPDFDGISALYLVQLITPDIPFIFVTGMTGELSPQSSVLSLLQDEGLSKTTPCDAVCHASLSGARRA